MGDAGECQTSNKKEYDDEDDEAPPAALDEGDIALLKTYGLGPYTTSIKNIEKEINEAKVGVVSNRRGRRLDSRLARPISSGFSVWVCGELSVARFPCCRCSRRLALTVLGFGKCVLLVLPGPCPAR